MPAQQEQLDAKEASSKAKAYFETVRGTFGLFDFHVHAAERRKTAGSWLITCSYLPSTSTSERLRYTVEVSASTGDIMNVRELAPQK